MAKKKTTTEPVFPRKYITEHYDAIEVGDYLRAKGWGELKVREWLDSLSPQCNGDICSVDNGFILDHPQFHDEEETQTAKDLVSAGLPLTFNVMYSW